MKNMASVRNSVEMWRGLTQKIHDALELASLEDESLREELEKETTLLEKQLQEHEFVAMLGGPLDHGSGIIND